MADISQIAHIIERTIEKTIDTGNMHGLLLCINEKGNASIGTTKGGKLKILTCPANTKKEISVVISPK